MLDFIASNIWFDYFLRLFASLICGFLLGFERKMKHHTVGIRTLTLICISSCLLSILSVFMADKGVKGSGDPTRIAAAIITGIGFLGAGTIVNQGLNIRGLTSAAIIFTAAALGTACGAALYIPALIVLIFSIISLMTVGRFERKFFPAEKRKILEIIISDKNYDENLIKKIIQSKGILIHDSDIKYSKNENQIVIAFTVKTPDELNSVELIEELSTIKSIKNITLTKN